MHTITHSIIVHTQVSDRYVNFALIYTTDHISPVLPIKYLVNQDGEPTMPQKLAIGMKTLVSNPRVLFFPCVVRKANTHVDKKLFKMRHQSQKCFWGIFDGITQHQKGYLIYIPSTLKIVLSHDVVFESFF